MALLSKEMNRSKLSAYKALPEYQASPIYLDMIFYSETIRPARNGIATDS